MAEFSRIQVMPAEEEDVVIIAGAVEEPESPDSDDALVGEAVTEETVAVEELPVAASRKRSPAYKETTLEDLQRTPVSGMQKAIIALAIVAVVAFIIWYVLLR